VVASLEERVAALEAEIGVIRQEAAAARALAAGADRDVADYRAELRGQTRMIGALRETQVEHFDHLSGLIDNLEATVVHIRDQHGAKLDGIAAMIGQLIEREGGGAEPTSTAP
jgi:hypothetical protein